MEIINEFKGQFETHITVSLKDDQNVEDFVTLCNELGVKPIFIQLPSGKYPSQLMTAEDSEGTLSEVKTKAHDLAKVMSDAGYDCIRVKIEAAPFNEDVPQTKEASDLLPDTMYYEHHVKVLLDDKQDELVKEVCVEFDAHLSKNAFKIRSDGLMEKFLTVRMYGAGMNDATDKTAKLMVALRERGIYTLKSVLEYCVFDTDSSIDEDWLDI